MREKIKLETSAGMRVKVERYRDALEEYWLNADFDVSEEHKRITEAEQEAAGRALFDAIAELETERIAVRYAVLHLLISLQNSALDGYDDVDIEMVETALGIASLVEFEQAVAEMDAAEARKEEA